MSTLRTITTLVLGAAAITCGTLSAVSAARLTTASSAPSAAVAAPAPANERVPTSRPDNPRPQRKLFIMQPSQFDAVIGRGDFAGTQWANIVIFPDRLEFLIGNRVTWTGSFSSLPRYDGRTSLGDVARLVATSPAPDWLRETSPGIYLLQVGMVQAQNTRLEVTAPEVKELRLASKPYVYVSGIGATVLFRDTKVMSWLAAEGRPDADPNRKRPFVSYDKGGRMDIASSEFSYLGTDAAKAYGVSWGDSTTGQVVGSVFHHNLFGVYLGKAVNVAFRHNVVHDNAIYGFDPHTASRGLVLVDNESYGNNSHGIIFSDVVVDSVVERNRSHDNGGNGIMMDEKCDRNVIRSNEVWQNRGDGIVLQGSSRNQVTENKITGNSVGVRVNANKLGDSDNNQVVGNQISENQRGIEVYGGARGTIARGNTVRNSIDQAIVFAEPATSDSDVVVGAQKAVVAQNAPVTIRRLTASEVDNGVVAAAGAAVTMEDSRITARDTGVEVEKTGTLAVVDSGGTRTVVNAARKGVVVDGAAELAAMSINDVERGILVGPDGRALINAITIIAREKGVEVAGAESMTRVRLLSSEIKAPEPLVGTPVGNLSSNRLSAVPSWLAIAGAVFVVLALFLHFGHRVWSPMSAVRHKVLPGSAGGMGDG